jgi:predicted dehydrogenase
MPPRPLDGTLVGLGQIAFGFNADRRRRGVWTHERAFARSGAVRLVGAADPSPKARARFSAARPEVPVFAGSTELFAAVRPELVSICVPTRLHLAAARQALSRGARALFCEKPLASSTREGAALLSAARKAKAVVAVNHVRRWDPNFLRAAALVKRGVIGRVVSISARYSGRVYNVGTHLIDAARMISGLDPVSACGFAPDPRAEDPDVSGILLLAGGATLTLAAHGTPTDLLFELDFVGTEGRLRLVDNGLTTVLERFGASRRYGGHRELFRASVPRASGEDRFTAAVRDLAACARRGGRPKCSGADGFAALAAAEALALSARHNGRPTPVAKLPKNLED